MSDEDSDRKPGSRRSVSTSPTTTTQSGVLGNLPHSRPVIRSPRRAESGAQDEGIRARRSEAQASPSTTGGTSPRDLDALARTGLAMAGGAASLGLRLAGRAAAVARGAVERR